MKNTKPDFICIGATKAATSWLYDRFNELPVFEMPFRKEIGYFDRYTTNTYSFSPLRTEFLIDRFKRKKWLFTAFRNTLSNLKNDYKTFPFWFRWYFSNYNDSWYQSLFSDKKLSGDITPSYAILESKDIAKIKAICPDTKIIYMLRIPIERDWSQYRMMNTETSDVNEIIKYLERKDVKKRSDYITNLRKYHKFFKPEQIIIAFYDAVQKQPKNLLDDLLIFLGSEDIDVEKYCKLKTKSNVSRSSIMPDEVEEYLKDYYFKDIQFYSEIFGGYASKWLDAYNGIKKKNNTSPVSTINLSNIKVSIF